jgi:hypothetical protein
MMNERITTVGAWLATFNLALPSIHLSLQIVLTALGILWLLTQLYFRWKKGE